MDEIASDLEQKCTMFDEQPSYLQNHFLLIENRNMLIGSCRGFSILKHVAYYLQVQKLGSFGSNVCYRVYLLKAAADIKTISNSCFCSTNQNSEVNF